MAEELCSGCGMVAEQHPFAGVTRDQESGLMTAYPICYLCFTNPAHRLVPLKMHFFDRASADEAVRAAEENILVDPPP